MPVTTGQKHEPARKPKHVTNKRRASDRVLPVLKGLIVLYAFLAGLRTVADPDLGWQMAAGRWIVQHKQIPSVDVFSYTAHGQPWIYPVGSQLLLYLVYAVGGYALLSLLGATVCALCVWIVVRRGSLWTAALAAIAVTVIADRTMARAAMFTMLLFASLLTVLWRYHQTGRAPLWTLPLLMLAWVNLHLGFVAGLALIAAYVGIEMIETTHAPRRKMALDRLRRSWVWLVAAVFATLINPWGWGVYRALARQQSAMKQQSFWIAEWAPLRLNWTAISSAFSLHTTKGDIYLLLAAAAAGVIVAMWRRRFAVALLLAAAAWLVTRHVRYDALFAVLVVVLASVAFGDATAHLAARFQSNRSLLLRRMAVLLIAAFVLFRISELVRGRNYLEANESVAFGVGLSPQMPSGAARFLAGADVGGNIFNTYDEGGFLTFAIGGPYLDYVDGRALPFGQAIISRSGRLSKAEPDSPEWQEEIAHYNITAIVLPLARYYVLEYWPALEQFCHSKIWKPVFLDESSAVFVLRSTQTLTMPPVDCATVALPAIQPTGADRSAFDHWVNAAAVLRSLGRNSEALAANEKALAIFPTSAYGRWNEAMLFLQTGNLPAAEEQDRLATEYDPVSPLFWTSLSDLYKHEGRLADAIAARAKASKLEIHFPDSLLSLGYLYLAAQRPQDARAAFDELSADFPADPQSVLPERFLARLLRGRAAVAIALGDSGTGQRLEDEAWRLNPGSPDDWRQLAHLYASYGHAADAQRAEERAKSLSGETR